MIQRIQSFYLTLVVVCVILMFIFPIAIYSFDVAGETTKTTLNIISKDSIVINQSDFINVLYLPIVAIVFGLLTLFIIFKYKNRVLQVRLIAFALLLNIGYIALIFFIAVDGFAKALEKISTTVSINYSIGTYLPLVSIVLLILAQNAIKRDERKVRSADRIR